MRRIQCCPARIKPLLAMRPAMGSYTTSCSAEAHMPLGQRLNSTLRILQDVKLSLRIIEGTLNSYSTPVMTARLRVDKRRLPKRYQPQASPPRQKR